MKNLKEFIEKHTDSGLYIVMDFINQEYPEYKTLKEAEDYIRDNFIDETEGIHPDIENIIIVKKNSFIFINEEKGTDNCDIYIEKF